MALEYIQLADDTKCSIFTEYIYPTVLWGDNYPNSDQKATFYAKFLARNFNFWIDGEFVYDFGTFTLTHKVVSSNNYEYITLTRKSDSTVLINWVAQNGSGRANLESYISFAIDNDTQLGYIFLASCQTISYNSNKWQYYIGSGSLQASGGSSDLYELLIGASIQSYTSNGGGATHIAKVTGQLKDLSSNLSDILMVSGGGGGGLIVGDTAYVGADAGGISGSGDNSANQSTGYGFGQGESSTNVSGGGAGLYGGYKGSI